jgi:hypothetical protein
VLRASIRGSQRLPMLVALLAALVASLPLAAPAAMPEATASAEPPALVVLFDASSAKLPQTEIRAAIGRELGCTVRETFDSTLGVVSVQVHQSQIVVGYQPPAGELERKLPVAAGAHQLPLLVALVAQNLVYRDAGIALPAAPAAVTNVAAIAPIEPTGGRPRASERRVTEDRPSDGPLSRSERSSEVYRSGVDLGARFGAWGRVSSALGDNDGGPSFGLDARLNLPLAGRVRLGAEGGVTRLANNPLALAGASSPSARRFWIAQVSVGPSVRLTNQGAPTEIELSSSVGMLYPFAIGEERADEQRSVAEDARVTAEYRGEIGYRLAAALGFRRWFGARWGIHGAIGVEHDRLLASRTEIEPGVAAPVQRQQLERLRWTEPTLQAGASLRF